MSNYAFPGSGNERNDQVGSAISSIFDFAKDLITQIGLGRFSTDGWQIREKSGVFYSRVERLRKSIANLERLDRSVADYIATLARERLKRGTSDSGGADFPTPPGTSFVVVKYLSEYVGGGEWPVLCADDLFPDDLAIIQELLQQELNKGGPPAYEVTVATEASLSRKDLIAMRIKWKDFSNRATTLDFPSDPMCCAFIEAKKFADELRRTDPTGVSQLRLPLTPGEKYFIAAPLGDTCIRATLGNGGVERVDKALAVEAASITDKPEAAGTPPGKAGIMPKIAADPRTPLIESLQALRNALADGPETHPVIRCIDERSSCKPADFPCAARLRARQR